MEEQVKEVEKDEELSELEKELVALATEREFVVSGEFNDKMADEFCEFVDKILAFDEVYKELYKDEELLDVVLTIQSPGGSCSSLNTMLDAMEDLDCRIIGKVRGDCFSCAFFLLCNCDIRLANSHSRMMYHSLLYNMNGSLSDHSEQYQESMKLMKLYDDAIVKNTRISQKQLDKVKKSKTDWFMGKDEALELGVLTHNCRLSDFYKMEDEEGAE